MSTTLFLQLVLIILTLTNFIQQSHQHESASNPISWRNNDTATPMGSFTFSDGSHVRPILSIFRTNSTTPSVTFGFFRNSSETSSHDAVYYLARVKFPVSSSVNLLDYSPVVLWCANRDHPVGEDASLEFKSDGNLVLSEPDGTKVWSTGTSGSSVRRMKIVGFEGDVILINNSRDAPIWQSSDFPTDTWLQGDRFSYFQRLTSSVSESNFATGWFYLNVNGSGIYVFNSSDPDKPYLTIFLYRRRASFDFGAGSLVRGLDQQLLYKARGAEFQYMRLEPDGHPRVYRMVGGYSNTAVVDLFKDDLSREEARSGNGGSRNRMKILFAVCLFIGISLLCLGCYFNLIMWNKKGRKESIRLGKSKCVVGLSSQVLHNSLRTFSYEELEAATNSFGVSLGQGGCGSVFEGTLRNGMKIAVKSLESNDIREGFLAEVKTLGSIHHFNLVKLVGYCSSGSKRFLVYEYMKNGSLEKWIFGKNRTQSLAWETRRRIIVGIAEGLKYLHVHCCPNIIHFDVKPQNILLDEEFNVKIADFGFAKLVETDASQVLTRLKGTCGYIAPEMFEGNVSVKADVYSFGVVVLEIICGRRNLDLSEDEILIALVRRKVEEGRLADLVEAQEDMVNNMDEAIRMLEIAIWCLQPSCRRPTMAMVMKVLEGSMVMEPISDYSFLPMTLQADRVSSTILASPTILPEVLSGPR